MPSLNCLPSVASGAPIAMVVSVLDTDIEEPNFPSVASESEMFSLIPNHRTPCSLWDY